MNYDRIQVATYYLAVFAARTDAYAIWTDEGWRAVREELTPSVVIGAFKGHKPVSSYTVGADNLTHVAALDVDLEDGLAIATKVARVMWAHGAPAFVERSRRGAHVWSILDARLPAIVVRRGLRAFLHLAEIAPDPKIELRPGSDRVGNDGLGFALRMPMMPHPATGRRYLLCNPETGDPIGQSLSEILLAFEQAPADAFALVAEQWKPTVDPRTIPSSFRRPRARDDDGPTVVELLGRMGITAVPGRAVKCPFHDDRHPSLSVARDERRVFCKSPNCEAHNAGRGLGSNQLAALIARSKAA